MSWAIARLLPSLDLSASLPAFIDRIGLRLAALGKARQFGAAQARYRNVRKSRAVLSS